MFLFFYIDYMFIYTLILIIIIYDKFKNIGVIGNIDSQWLYNRGLFKLVKGFLMLL